MIIAKIRISNELSIPLDEDSTINGHSITDNFKEICRIVFQNNEMITVENKQAIYYLDKSKILYIKSTI